MKLSIAMFLVGSLSLSLAPCWAEFPPKAARDQLSKIQTNIQAEAPSMGKKPDSAVSLSLPPKVILILEDPETEKWAAEVKSEHDGLPIMGTNLPMVRFRELLGRLQKTLNDLPQPPLAVIWDYSFPNYKPESNPATVDFAQSLLRSPFPVVLGERTYSGHPLCPMVYAATFQENKFRGENYATKDAPGIPSFIPIRFTPALPPAGDPLAVTEPLSIVAAAAVLVSTQHLEKEEALFTAHKLAEKAARTNPAAIKIHMEDGKDIDASGIKFTSCSLEEISMKQVILRDPAALGSLAGAIVVVGDATEDIITIEGKPKSGCYLHACTLLQILKASQPSAP